MREAPPSKVRHARRWRAPCVSVSTRGGSALALTRPATIAPCRPRTTRRTARHPAAARSIPSPLGSPCRRHQHLSDPVEPTPPLTIPCSTQQQCRGGVSMFRVRMGGRAATTARPRATSGGDGQNRPELLGRTGPSLERGTPGRVRHRAGNELKTEGEGSVGVEIHVRLPAFPSAARPVDAEQRGRPVRARRIAAVAPAAPTQGAAYDRRTQGATRLAPGRASGPPRVSTSARRRPAGEGASARGRVKVLRGAGTARGARTTRSLARGAFEPVLARLELEAL